MLAEGQRRETWEMLFHSQGLKHPQARMRMLDGFSEGWIDFEAHRNEIICGQTKLDSVIREMVPRQF